VKLKNFTFFQPLNADSPPAGGRCQVLSGTRPFSVVRPGSVLVKYSTFLHRIFGVLFSSLDIGNWSFYIGY